MKDFLFSKLLPLCVVFFASLNTSYADTGDEMTCPDAKVIEDMVTNICWDCFIPFRVMGFGGPDIPDGAAEENQFGTCMCSDLNGIVEPGAQIGYWFPSKLVELSKEPFCISSLGGLKMGFPMRMVGGRKSTESDTSDKTFYNYHTFSYPLFSMLDLWLSPSCYDEPYADMDVLMLSEFDPLWSNDWLALVVYWETALFANPLTYMTCMGDCAAATAGEPAEDLFFCSGCWGNTYPLTGHTSANVSPVSVTSLLKTKAIATSHRRGLSKKSVGDDAMCGSDFSWFMPKSQYKSSMIFPMPEADSSVQSCCHEIGSSTMKWGEWRQGMPGPEENAHVYNVWQYRDCCMR